MKSVGWLFESGWHCMAPCTSGNRAGMMRDTISLPCPYQKFLALQALRCDFSGFHWSVNCKAISHHQGHHEEGALLCADLFQSCSSYYK